MNEEEIKEFINSSKNIEMILIDADDADGSYFEYQVICEKDSIYYHTSFYYLVEDKEYSYPNEIEEYPLFVQTFLSTLKGISFDIEKYHKLWELYK